MHASFDKKKEAWKRDHLSYSCDFYSVVSNIWVFLKLREETFSRVPNCPATRSAGFAFHYQPAGTSFFSSLLFGTSCSCCVTDNNRFWMASNEWFVRDLLISPSSSFLLFLFAPHPDFSIWIVWRLALWCLGNYAVQKKCIFHFETWNLMLNATRTTSDSYLSKSQEKNWHCLSSIHSISTNKKFSQIYAVEILSKYISILSICTAIIQL